LAGPPSKNQAQIPFLGTKFKGIHDLVPGIRSED